MRRLSDSATSIGCRTQIDEAQLGLEVEPVGGGEARARVLETPVVVLAQRGQGGGAGLRHVCDPGIVDRHRRQRRRVVPGAPGGLEQLVVAVHDRLVLPEALGVVLGRVDELLGARPDQVQPGVVQGAGDHRRAGPVHPGDGDGHRMPRALGRHAKNPCWPRICSAAFAARKPWNASMLAWPVTGETTGSSDGQREEVPASHRSSQSCPSQGADGSGPSLATSRGWSTG